MSLEQYFREGTMKLSVITASIIAYALIAAAWICYTELTLP